MTLRNVSKTLLSLFFGATLGLSSLMAADVVSINNGARLVGQITKIEGGVVYLSTAFAGDLEIKQSEVISLTTDEPIVVRLQSGTTLQGKLSGQNSQLTLAGPDGTLSTQVDKVAATWAPGQEDPQIVALRKQKEAMERHWSYEATVDIAGKTGNSEQLGTAVGFRAKLQTDKDTLQLYTTYDRQEADGVKSADQFRAGLDYQNNFSGRKSWYVRDEGGFDRVKDIEIYNVAAAGMGYDFIKTEQRILTGRAGLSFRYEGYKNPATSDVKSLGLDFGINHEATFEHSRLVNRISWVPSFEDFSNFRLTHESFLEIPLANPAWKLRLGLSNDYNSKPGVGIDKLDTTYFTRFVLNWN